MKKIYSFLFCLMIVFPFFQVYSQTVYTVNASNFAFTPKTITTAVVGDTIRFMWVVGTHTTTSTSVPSGAITWDHPLISTNNLFDYVIKAPGVYMYKCTPHVGIGMIGEIDVNSVTPVKLINFTAATTGDKAQLNWQTASEENSDHFSIQQSYNGQDFTEVGVMPAAGKSNATLQYSYIVSNILANKPYVYFRLLTIDRDKKQQYSDIVLLHFGKVVDQNLINSFYPNPAENGDHLLFSFNADFDGKIQLTIFDPSGRNLYSLPITATRGFNQSHFPLPKLRKGAYFVQFVLGDRKQTMPLFIK